MSKEQPARRWRDVRAEAVRAGRIDPARVEKGKQDLLDQVRAYRLAEIRKAQGRTQKDVADELDVSQARVSALEGGDLSKSALGTISDYVEALGGRLKVVADFGDHTVLVSGSEQLKLASPKSSGRAAGVDKAAEASRSAAVRRSKADAAAGRTKRTATESVRNPKTRATRKIAAKKAPAASRSHQAK